MQDGIYMNLDDATYHALPRLSASGIGKLLVSPATFWAQSWLNPNRAQRDDDTRARVLGRAYHMARFEPWLLSQHFARGISKDDMPEDTLFTDSEIKAAFKEAGVTQAKAGETVLERAHRLRDSGWPGHIWHIAQEEFEEQLNGRTPIDGPYWDQLIRDTDSIHQNPEVAEHMTGGAPEVSVLWTCPETGIPMKARIDWLRATGFTDFKTFDNARGRPLEQAIFDAFRFNRYYIQASLYWCVVDMIRQGALTIEGDHDLEQAQLIENIRAMPADPEVWYVFQEKNGVPNLLAYQYETHAPHDSYEQSVTGADEAGAATARRRMSSPTAIHRKAMIEIAHAKRLFLTYSEVYAPGQPWFPIRPLGKISDDSFNPRWLEETP